MIKHIVEECQCEGRQCTKCEAVKCIGMFHTRREKGYVYLRAYCKVCKQTQDRVRLQEHNEAINARRRVQRQLRASEINARQRSARAIHGHQWNKSRRIIYASDSDYAEKVRMQNRTFQRRHTEYHKMRLNLYRQKNLDRLREYDRKRYLVSDKRRLSPQMFRKTHPERARMLDKVHHHKRRTNKTLAGGHFTVQEWKTLKEKYDYACLCCGRREPEIRLTPDHVIPVIKLGSSNIENIQSLCISCNSKKRDKIIDYRISYRQKESEQDNDI